MGVTAPRALAGCPLPRGPLTHSGGRPVHLYLYQVPARKGRTGKTHRGRRSRHRQRGSRGGQIWRKAGDGAQLKICALNIQSLKPKILELNRELTRFNYDIVVISEAWLKASTPNRLLVFPGYNLYRADRKFAPKGYGGVAVLFRDGIVAKRIGVPPAASDSKLESLWTVFKWDRQVLVVGAV